MGWPICKVEVYGQRGAWSLDLEGTGEAPSGDLLQVRTQKQLGVETPAGTFDLRLATHRDDHGRTWMDRILPQDVVVIQMMHYHGRTDGRTGAGQMHTVMIGLVDTITLMSDLTPQGIPQRQIQVRGRDVGKVFIAGMVTYFTFAGASLLGAQEFLSQALLNVSPDLVIVRLLKQIYQRFLRIEVHGPGGTTLDLWDLLGYRLETFSGEIPAGLDYQFLAGEGNFWSFFVKAASPPFHELFVDTRRTAGVFEVEGGGVESLAPRVTLGQDQSAPVLFLRPTPFPYLLPSSTAAPPPTTQETPEGVPITLADVTVNAVQDRWEQLPTHEVGADDLLGEPFQDLLSRSDQEQYNVYLAFSHYNALGREMYLLTVPPVLDAAKFQRYGYKPLMPNTWLTQSGRDDDPDFIAFYRKLTWRLASWYCLNDRFLSGQKTFKLLPHVHIGERLLDRTPGAAPQLFYVERVSHLFSAFEQATTTLGLTRGLSLAEYDRYERELRAATLTTPARAADMVKVFRDLMRIGQRVD